MAKPSRQLELISEQVHDIWVEFTKHIKDRVSPLWQGRWKKLWVDYDKLPEIEKKKDRKFARRIQTVVDSSEKKSFAYELGCKLAEDQSYFRRGKWRGLEGLSRVQGMRKKIRKFMGRPIS